MYYNLCLTAKVLTCNGPAVTDAKARYWSKVAIFATVRGGHRQNIAITLDAEKLEWYGYQMAKFFGRYVYPF